MLLVTLDREFLSCVCPPKKYLQGSAQKIDLWFKTLGIRQAFHIILQNFYRAAWREDNYEVADMHAPLLKLRSFRNRMWWSSIKDLPYHARRSEGCAQRTSGEKPAWEDPLVLYLGLDWRL